jgi:large subunit ribosomal protein L1
MGKVSKNYKAALGKIEEGKQYQLREACDLVKTLVSTKFDSSVDVDIRLGVDPKKANQMVRGVVTLPNGTGKDKKVLVLCTPDKEEEAKAAGADYVGLDEYINKISGGWTDVDVIITMPSCMGAGMATIEILVEERTPIMDTSIFENKDFYLYYSNCEGFGLVSNA